MTSARLSGHRDKVIAACLVGAVVVVIGYASGIGLRTEAAATPAVPPAAAPAAPPVGQPPAGGLPVAVPPPAGAIPPAAAPAVAPPASPPAQPVPGTPPPGPPATTPPHDDHPVEPNPGDDEPQPECDQSVLRSLTELLLPSDDTSAAPTLPRKTARDDDTVEDALDLLVGDCEEPPEDEPDEPDGHGGD